MARAYHVWEIEREASEVLRRAYGNDVPDSHIDIDWIIESSMGLGLVPIPGLRRAYGIDGVLCCYTDGTCAIVVDEDLLDHRPNRYRFTLGEELGHYVLHGDYLSQVNNVEDAVKLRRRLAESRHIDRNARRFAAAVLVPMSTLVPNASRVYSELVRVAGTDDHAAILKYMAARLSKLYGVSSEAMSHRLNESPGRLAQRVRRALKEGLASIP